jgi:hypothetical protein
MAFADDSPETPGSDKFANTVAEHQEELQSLFQSFGADSVQELILAGIGIYLKILIVATIFQFIVEGGIAKMFSAVFVPVFNNFQRAALWAGAQLGVRVVVLILLVLALIVTGATHNGFLGLILMIFVVLLWFGIALVVTAVIYQIGIGMALGLNLGCVIVVGVLLVGSFYPLQTLVFSPAWDAVVKEHLVVKIQAETANVLHQLQEAQNELAKEKKATQDLQDAIAAEEVKQVDLNKQIAARVLAPDYTFAALAHLRATGKLDDALAGYKDFPNKFPGSPYIPDAQNAVQDIEKQIADEAAEQKRRDDEAKLLAATKEKELHDHMAAGKATLSEIRNRILGLSRADVKGIFGDPDEDAADRWGYGKQMIIDPLTGQQHGLQVEFFQGVVRSVDYYYGAPRDR